MAYDHSIHTDPQTARITLLGLFTEFDVKGKYSLKLRVWTDSQPVDILGVLLARLGYTSQGQGATDIRLQKVLAISDSWVRSIYGEIDRPASTNESILALVKQAFDIFPLTTQAYA